MAQTGTNNHELEQMISNIAPQSPASNNPAMYLIPTEQFQPATPSILLPKLTPANYSQLSFQYPQIIPKLIINNFIPNLENPPLSNLNFYASSKISNCLINLPQLT